MGTRHKPQTKRGGCKQRAKRTSFGNARRGKDRSGNRFSIAQSMNMNLPQTPTFLSEFSVCPFPSLIFSRASAAEEASAINTRTNYLATLHLSRYAIVYLQSDPPTTTVPHTHPPPASSALQPDDTRPKCCSPLRFHFLFSSLSPPSPSSSPSFSPSSSLRLPAQRQLRQTSILDKPALGEPGGLRWVSELASVPPPCRSRRITIRFPSLRLCRRILPVFVCLFCLFLSVQSRDGVAARQNAPGRRAGVCLCTLHQRHHSVPPTVRLHCNAPLTEG